MIELVGLNKHYENVTALQDVNLFIQEGEIFGIIGKSGAGKSTLLRCINLLERPDTGEVIVDHINITALTDKQLRDTRHKIGMIFQQFNLVSTKTVYENIAIPMRIQGVEQAAIDNKIDELLTIVELTDKKHVFPSQLSGGQKQRVAIARALSCSPKILLCDEATSALDPETTASILELLRKINKLYGITIVLITHEMEVVKRICHRLAVMQDGKILEVTSLSQALNNPKSIARSMLHSQLSPKLPECLLNKISPQPTNLVILRLFFQEEDITLPFISKTSRELHCDINILLANIDQFDTLIYGVLIIELSADKTLLDAFLQRCQNTKLTAEILGYVGDTHL